MASDSNKDINNETEVLDENSKKECHKCKLLEEENRKLEEENRKLVDEIEKFNNDLIGNKDFNKTLAAIIDKHKKEIKSKDDKIESKDEEIKSKDKEIKSKDDEIINLKKRHQYELGSAKTFRLSDDDKNNPTNLNEDISQIQEDLEFYVTNLRPKTDIEINLKNISRLLNDSKVKKTVLQRHVLRTILDYFDKYNRKNSLELQFLKQAEDLENLAKRLEKEPYTKATVFIRNNSLLNSSDKNPNSIAKFFRIFI
uniref:Uncharacterized protein n=1 Tax=Rhizophagus irregularis (strain DAOM 181602 / DAOM 197198 / MUCL 43194) TaxID=747089 RepID=U9SVS7_RHIID